MSTHRPSAVLSRRWRPTPPRRPGRRTGCCRPRCRWRRSAPRCRCRARAAGTCWQCSSPPARRGTAQARRRPTRTTSSPCRNTYRPRGRERGRGTCAARCRRTARARRRRPCRRSDTSAGRRPYPARWTPRSPTRDRPMRRRLGHAGTHRPQAARTSRDGPAPCRAPPLAPDRPSSKPCRAAPARARPGNERSPRPRLLPPRAPAGRSSRSRTRTSRTSLPARRRRLPRANRRRRTRSFG